ncbi:hypothetical protein [Spirosoma validum]|uniref:DUF3300 domain-containing protein n=1 Tax=Spirosoma validum TaxID=2771355 RepID=A0A927AXM3_9BACT|nr:hypothetical protein [Spirosoma validum]MBD2751653.1 hypothetical protein [Spirosoma validum]
MKTLLILAGLLVGTSLHQTSQAQVNVNINIGSQPLWGPTGYDYVNYYYLPDLDIYYYVPLQQWIYFDGGRWITTTALPSRYNSYDLYRMHKVVINDQQPYLHNATYRKKYASFKGRYDQSPIRDSRDSKYYVINNHPMHNQAVNGRPGGNPEIQVGRNGSPQAQNGRPQANGGHQERNDRAQNEHRGPR